jgi:hypothetical protein
MEYLGKFWDGHARVTALLSIGLPFLALAQQTQPQPYVKGDIQVQVLEVTCQSGAPVNFEETARPGDVGPAERADIGSDMIMRLPMNADGNQYRTGKPPCPKGDVLQIKVKLLNPLTQ